MVASCCSAPERERPYERPALSKEQGSTEAAIQVGQAGDCDAHAGDGLAWLRGEPVQQRFRGSFERASPRVGRPSRPDVAGVQGSVVRPRVVDRDRRPSP